MFVDYFCKLNKNTSVYVVSSTSKMISVIFLQLEENVTIINLGADNSTIP